MLWLLCGLQQLGRRASSGRRRQVQEQQQHKQQGLAFFGGKMRGIQAAAARPPDLDDLGGGGGPGDGLARLQTMRAASCIRILGKGVIRVVHRVDDARESCRLGERGSILRHVKWTLPVYHLVQHWPFHVHSPIADAKQESTIFRSVPNN